MKMNENLLEVILNIMLNSSQSQVKTIQHTNEGIEAILVDIYDGETYHLTLEKELHKC